MPDYSFVQIFYRTVTPLHVGVGSDAGRVDLPVARERLTRWPFVPGSGIRGAMRSLERRPADRKLLFGPEDPDDGPASPTSIHDAHLLFLPVRASKELFFWVTCPAALRRYEDARVRFLGARRRQFSGPKDEESYLGHDHGALLLEEFEFQHSGAASLPTEVPGVDFRRVAVVDDRAFAYWAEYAMDVRTRNRLTSSKRVKEGHLFSVEAVPAESVFFGVLGMLPQRAEDGLGRPEIEKKLREHLGVSEPGAFALVLGGNESVGMGVVDCRWAAAGQGIVAEASGA